MYKNKSNKFKLILITLIIIACLFPKNIVYAETYTNAKGESYTYTTVDDGSDGPEVSELIFELTRYGGTGLGSEYPESKMTKNPEYGWMEYTEDGVTYVVFAAATHEMLSENKGRSDGLWFFGAKFDHIHYFKYPQKFQFQFVDPGVSSEVFYGIVLDSGDFMMLPQHDKFGREKEVDGKMLNGLDAYFGPTGQTDPDPKGISGKRVEITMDGTFSGNSNKQVAMENEIKRNIFFAMFTSFFSKIGDALQILMQSAINGTSIKENSKLLYTRDEIEISVENNGKLQVSNSDTFYSGGKNTLKTVDIDNKIANEYGEEIVVYDTDTKIPIYDADVYAMSNNSIKIFNINFFKETEKKEKNKFYSFIKDVVKMISRIVLYISAALLLTMIIFRAIIIVYSSIGGNPEKMAESKKIISKIFKAIIMIAGIYLLAAFIINAYEYVNKLLLNDNDSNFLIRLRVIDTYAFNTNFTGWIKYKTLILNDLQSLFSSLIYLITAVINLIWFLLMFARVFIIALLIIIAPLTAVNEIGGIMPQNNIITRLCEFKNWIKAFNIFVWLPMIMLIICRILMH